MTKSAGAPAKTPGDPFPASEKTPGQRESRQSYAELLKRKAKPKWWPIVEDLIAAGLTWRKAVYVAWRICPKSIRWPKTIEELATNILGLSSARTIRKWHQNDPRIEEFIGKWRMKPVMEHLSETLDAMFKVAARPTPEGNRDRRLHAEIAGILKTRHALELMGEGGGPIQIQDLDDEYRRDMEALTRRLNEPIPTPAEDTQTDEDGEDEDNEE